MTVTRTGIKLTLVKGFGSVITFGGISFIAHQLTSSQLGSFFLFEALLAMVALPADFGIRGAIEKRISEGEGCEEYLFAGIALKLAPLVIISALILVFRDLVNSYVGENIALLLILTLFAREYALLTTRVVAGELRVGETAELQFVRQLMWVVVGGLLSLIGWGVRGLVFGLVLGYLLMLIYGVYKISLSLCYPSFEHLESIFEYSKYNLISASSNNFYKWMDIVILGLFVLKSQIGAYEVAWRLTLFGMLFSSALARTIFPKISSLHSDGKVGEISNLIQEATTMTMLFILPVFFGTAILSTEMLELFFGPEYTSAWLVLIILMGEKIVRTLHLMLGRPLQALDQPDLAARATVGSIGSNLVMNFVLVWYLGIEGAALATLISSVIHLALHYRYLSRIIAIEFRSKIFLKGILSSAVMVSVLFILKLELGIRSIVDLIAFILVGAVIYLGCILMDGWVRNLVMDQLFEHRSV